MASVLIVGKILLLCKGITSTVSDVNANKKRCNRLAERVEALAELVESIQQRGLDQSSPNVSRALSKLSTSLNTAQELVKKCTEKKILIFLLKSEFDNVNALLNDTFQTLSLALQVEHEGGRRRLFQDYTEEEDDEEWDSGLALESYSGAMAPVLSPPAAAPMPYFAKAAPVPYPPAGAPVPYPPAGAPVPYPSAGAPMPCFAKAAPVPYPSAGAPVPYPSAGAPMPCFAEAAPVPYPSAGAPMLCFAEAAPVPYPSAGAPVPYPSADAPIPYFAEAPPVPYPLAAAPYGWK